MQNESNEVKPINKPENNVELEQVPVYGCPGDSKTPEEVNGNASGIKTTEGEGLTIGSGTDMKELLVKTVFDEAEFTKALNELDYRGWEKLCKQVRRVLSPEDLLKFWDFERNNMDRIEELWKEEEKRIENLANERQKKFEDTIRDMHEQLPPEEFNEFFTGVVKHPEPPNKLIDKLDELLVEFRKINETLEKMVR